MINMKTKVQNRSTKNDPVIRALPEACADEEAAVEFVERMRWGGHPACPHCGDTDVYQMMNTNNTARQANYRWRCRGCKAQFTVRIGTVFEDSRIELRHWCFAFWRASTSKKGVSALEIHRQTGVSYKSALFMLHRIRYAMSESAPAMLGQDCGDVEVDETYVGGKPRYRGTSKRGRGTKKQCVLALVERNGSVKTKPIANVSAKTLQTAIRQNVDGSARIVTDENSAYTGIGKHYARGHQTVCHSAHEYVRGDVYSNTVESFFATVKRGINGIYHSVSKEHLSLYLSEYEFGHNNRNLEDGERTAAAIRKAQGKRLLYKQPVTR